MLRWQYPVVGSLLALALLFCQGCSFLVNQMAFYPTSGSTFDATHYDTPIHHRFLTTEDQVNISTFYLPNPESHYAALLFHGNAGNASDRLSHAVAFQRMGFNVLLVDYRGYGLSHGSASEAGIYRDAKTALAYLQTQGYRLNDIIIHGKSLGSAVAVHVAQHQPFAAVILSTPLSSGDDIADTMGLSWLTPLLGHPFDSLSKIQHLRAPLLVLHGAQDQILPIAMGKKLFQHATITPKHFVTFPDATHNDIIARDPAFYFDQIQQFLNTLPAFTRPQP